MREEAAPPCADNQVPQTALNVVLRVLHRCGDQGDRLAVVSATERISYGALEKLIRLYAGRLAAHRVVAGDVVALAFDDETELTLSMLAVLYLGAAVLVVPRATVPGLRGEWIRRSRARILVSDSASHLPADIPGLHIARQRVHLDAQTEIEPVRNPAGPALIIVGSGSTGKARLLPVSHLQLSFRLDIQNERFGLRAGQPDRLFTTSHIEYPSAAVRVLGTLAVGASVLFRDKSTVTQLHDAISNHAVSVVLGTVLHVERLLAELPESTGPVWTGLRVLGLTSSTVTDDLRARIRQRLTEQLYVIYGTNESMSLTVADPTMTFRTPGTVGRPSRGVQIELIDSEGLPVPRGAIGRIRARSPGQIDGYLDDPEQTRAFFQDGWFVPGDLGKFTDDDELIFYGRSDDMMILNGVNIYPAEIEQCLARHPAVRDAAVISVRHPVHQDLPLAAVALHAGASASAEMLHRYAYGHLGFRCPRAILLLGEIPRTSQGKVDRETLRRRFESLPGFNEQSAQ